MNKPVRALTYIVTAGVALGVGTAIGGGSHATAADATPTVTVTATPSTDVAGQIAATAAAPAPTVTVTVTQTITASPVAAATSAPAKPKSDVLFDQSGSGIYTGPEFILNGPVTVSYSFDCSSFGSPGNFIGDIETGDQSSLTSDDQIFANGLAESGSKTVTVYPQDPGSEYHVAINSECAWTVRVVATS